MDHPHDRFRMPEPLRRQAHPAHAKALGQGENPPSFTDEGNFPPPSFFPTAEATTEGGTPLGPPAILLQRGNQGDTVRDLQTMLRRLGLPVGQVDGAFGPLTEQAVRLFQGQVGLPVTGQVDDATWGLLHTSVPGSQPIPPPAPAPSVSPPGAAQAPAAQAPGGLLGMPIGFWVAVGILAMVMLSTGAAPAPSFRAK